MPKQNIHSNLNDSGLVDREFENIYGNMPELYVASAVPADTPPKIGNIAIENTNNYAYVATNKATSAWQRIALYGGSSTFTSGAFTQQLTVASAVFFTDLPTASAGLTTGRIWNSSGTLKVI